MIGWLRHNLFSSWGNAFLTVVALYIVWRLVDGVVSWGIVNAVWSGDSGEACKAEGSGACWVFIRARFAQFMYGQYPVPERWRVDLLGALHPVHAFLGVPGLAVQDHAHRGGRAQAHVLRRLVAIQLDHL